LWSYWQSESHAFLLGGLEWFPEVFYYSLIQSGSCVGDCDLHRTVRFSTVDRDGSAVRHGFDGDCEQIDEHASHLFLIYGDDGLLSGVILHVDRVWDLNGF